MRVSKNKLIIGCIVAFVAIIIGGAIFHSIQKERREEQRQLELEQAIKSLIDDEYNKMYNEYKGYVNVILNDSYSCAYRHPYIEKINDLVVFTTYDYSRYIYSDWDRQKDIDSFKSKYKDCEQNVKGEFMGRAAERVRKMLLE